MKELNDKQLDAVTFAYKNSIHDMGFYKSMKSLGLIKEEFEVGKWYKGSSDIIGFYESRYGNYGIGYKGEWSNDVTMDDFIFWTPATDKEVETALIKEAKKLIVKGVVKCLHECTNISSIYDVEDFNWDGRCLRVDTEDGCCCIFDKGKWATIIEEPKVKEMTMQEVNKALGYEIKIKE